MYIYIIYIYIRYNISGNILGATLYLIFDIFKKINIY